MANTIVFDTGVILEKWNELRIAGGYPNDSSFAEHLLEQEEKLQLFTPEAVLDTLAESDEEAVDFKRKFDAIDCSAFVTNDVIIPPNQIKKEKDVIQSDNLVQPIVRTKKKPGRKPKLKATKLETNDVIGDDVVPVDCVKDSTGNTVSIFSGRLGQVRKWFHKCELCLMYYKTADGLRVHREKCNGKQKRKKPKKKKPVKVVVKKDRKNKKKPNFCTICNKMLGPCYKLSKHMQTVHCSTRSFTCDICSKAFKSKDGLRIHERRVHKPVERLQCDQCEKTFSCNHSLKMHLKMHSMDDTAVCVRCGEQFESKRLLYQHKLANHANDRHINCKLCEKKFFTRSGLQYHMKRHRGEAGKKKLPCEYCGKPFNVGTRLREHINSHTGERPYECTVCGKRFGKSKHLKQHSVVHTGLRPFKCKLCPKTFTASGSLHTHMKVHKAEAARQGAHLDEQALRASTGSGNITRAEAEVTRLRIIEEMSMLYGLHGENFS